jgi:hypothetical protein
MRRFIHEAEDLVVFAPDLYKIGCHDELARQARPIRINLTKSPIAVSRGEGGGVGTGGPLWSPVVLFPVLTCGGNALTPPAPGDHKGPPFPTPPPSPLQKLMGFS